MGGNLRYVDNRTEFEIMYQSEKEQMPALNRQFGKRGCCLVGHFSGFWKFASRPSLTIPPPDAKRLKRWASCGQRVADNDGNKNLYNMLKRKI